MAELNGGLFKTAQVVSTLMLTASDQVSKGGLQLDNEECPHAALGQVSPAASVLTDLSR
jgi:hypothetical protein